MNKGNNEELIKELCKIAPCRVGGGIRNVEKAKRILANGARKIIIGTAASEVLLSQLPKDKLIVAIDSNKGRVVTEGWTKDTGSTPDFYVKRFENFCSGYLYTIVEKEGMMSGTDIEAIKKIKSMTKNDLVAAGGISSIEEIKELEKT
jgi:phosphoribosylformimino-5-aminoimidazole carboxamide ribonucleotide (ProFAR) isomerase